MVAVLAGHLRHPGHCAHGGAGQTGASHASFRRRLGMFLRGRDAAAHEFRHGGVADGRADADGLWPVLLMVAGLLILGSALKSPLLTLLAGACFAVFCVVGLVWYAVPGSVEHVVISAPYGRDYYIEMPPWFD